GHKRTIYIPDDKTKSVAPFHPLDRNWVPHEDLECTFDNQGVFNVKFVRGQAGKLESFRPKILLRKGDRKEDVNSRLVKSLSKSVCDVRTQLEQMHQQVIKRQRDLGKDLESLFVGEQKTSLATTAIQQQIDGLELRIKDCERLVALCQA
ncbi:MAG: ATPase, partial [Pseudohongiella sp.]|nr:ATPase [Pseudohongiella sp.]